MSRYQDALARNDLDETESVEQETPEAEPVHEEEGGPSNDPVRMYLKSQADVCLAVATAHGVRWDRIVTKGKWTSACGVRVV